MWARIAEISLGIWLFLSHWIFSMQGWSDGVIALCILFFATLSFIERLNKMHLLHVFPASWLLYLSYTYPAFPLPFAIQNHILIALSLLMFALIPSHASDHPRPWKRFLKKGTP